MERIRDIERNSEDYVWLVQNGQPLQHDRIANRIIELKYEGISGKYKTKLRINENEFFPVRQ